MANVRKLKINQYQRLIKSLVTSKIVALKNDDENYNTPTFIWGPPGIGKSQIISDICKDNDWIFFDLRLSQIDPTDLRGVPYFNPVTGTAEFKVFGSVLPSGDDKRPGVLLLDEFPQASDMVQSASYQLIHDRKIGSYVLPKNIVTIAAGNREEDGGVFFEMPGALKNRFDHVELDIDYDGFVKYMSKKAYDENIVAYLLFNNKNKKEHLYSYKPEHMNFPTFRSWEKAAQKIKYGTNFSDAISDSVGQHVALDFETFKELTKDIPSADRLIKESIYYEEVEKQLVSCQKVGNILLIEDNRKKLKDEEKWDYFYYFVNMKNPGDKNDRREELTILFLTNMKDDFDVLEEINEGFHKRVKTDKAMAKKLGISDKEMKECDNIYTLIFKKWGILDEIDN